LFSLVFLQVLDHVDILLVVRAFVMLTKIIIYVCCGTTLLVLFKKNNFYIFAFPLLCE
jgi:hypothetical protein